MASVIAALDISEKGYEVVLIEARDRVGGRTYMDHACGDILELGGGYAH